MKPTGKHLIAEFVNCDKGILNDKEKIESFIKEGLKICGMTLVDLEIRSFNPMGITAIAIISESHVAIHTYPEARHASIDVFTCSPDQQKPGKLLEYFKEKFSPVTMRKAEILRGNPLDIVHTDWMTDFSESLGFDIRYHVEKHLLHKRSKFQQIDVIENESFGRMLFLDHELQIADSDAYLYNESMVSPLIEKRIPLENVAILGGGDGGVLFELLKHDVKSVTMVDIDPEVISVSREYLPEVCHNAFEDSRLKLVHQDVNRFLDNMHDFNAVIYDLTMHPEQFIKIDREEYLTGLFEKIRNNLSENGLISVQCCSQFDDETFVMIDRILKSLFADVQYRMTFIPSYCVPWRFASARKRS